LNILSKAMLMVLLIPLLGSAEIIVLNKGIGGNSSAEGVARFDRDVAANNPQFVIIFFGHNDAYNPGKLAELPAYKANLEQMVDKTRGIGAQPVLVTLNPIIESIVLARGARTGQAKPVERNAPFASAICEVAEEKQVLLADLRSEIEARGGASESADCLIRNPANSKAQDGVHLTADGYQLLAATVAEVLRGKVKNEDTIICFGDSLTYGTAMEGAGTSSGETYPAVLDRLLNGREACSK